MISRIFEIFWVEKIKLFQWICNQTHSLTGDQLTKTPPGGSSILSSLRSLADYDSHFAKYLPLSLRISQFPVFTQYNQDEIEVELVKIQDRFLPPALPPHLSELIPRSSSDIDLRDVQDKHLLDLLTRWKKAHQEIEAMLLQIPEKESYRYRYFTLTGWYTLPAAVNLITTNTLNVYEHQIHKTLTHLGIIK